MTVCVAMLALLSRGKTTSSAILIAAAFVGAWYPWASCC